MSDFREDLIEAMAQDLRHRMGLSSAAFDHDHPLPGLACTPEFLMECALAVAESFRQTVECPDCGGTGTSSWVQGGVRYQSGDIPCPAGCIDGRVPGETRIAIVERQVGWGYYHEAVDEIALVQTNEDIRKQGGLNAEQVEFGVPVFLLAPDLPEIEGDDMDSG